MEVLRSSELQAHLVLALSGATSAYVTVARPTLSHPKDHGPHGPCPPATLREAGTSPALSSRSLGLMRALLAVYILAMGAAQMSRLGLFVFKFYTIWNWWLLGLYFGLAALASFQCAAHESGSASGSSGSAVSPDAVTSSADVDGGVVSPAKQTAAQQRRGQGRGDGWALNGPGSGSRSGRGGKGGVRLLPLDRPTPLARCCHALFLTNASTVIIVDVVCWGVLYPMLARGPQSPEIERMIRRLLLTFTSYNQHGLNAVYIFTDLLLNRHRLVFHAVGPLGLWSLLYGLWAHVWHAKTGKWLYPFLDTSKPWAPLAYLGLYAVHWLAFGLVALMFRVKQALHRGEGDSDHTAAGSPALEATGNKEPAKQE